MTIYQLLSNTLTFVIFIKFIGGEFPSSIRSQCLNTTSNCFSIKILDLICELFLKTIFYSQKQKYFLDLKHVW